jgi:hypothetical protein
MTITVAASGRGELVNACRDYEGIEGTDDRGLDLPLVTLRATSEGRMAEVVCFRNPDFERQGPRKRLLDQPMAWHRETRR